MMRRCDGTDPNLILQDYDPVDVTSLTRVPYRAHRPCDCGAVFDDVERSVIFPHYPVRVDLDALANSLQEFGRTITATMERPFDRPGQCQECGAYTISGAPAVTHHRACESSGTAQHYRHMTNPDEHAEDPRYVERITQSFINMGTRDDK